MRRMTDLTFERFSVDHKFDPLQLRQAIKQYLIVNPLLFGQFRIAAEFSTVSCFVVPLIVLSGCRALHSWAAYSALMAGFFCNIAMILAGGQLYGSIAPLEVYLSLFCHGTLYFCGFAMIASERYAARESRKLLLGTGLIALRAELLRPWVIGRERMLIYILLDGAAVKRLLPEGVWPALPVYYVLVGGFLLLTVRSFFRASRRQYRKFSGTGLVCTAA